MALNSLNNFLTYIDRLRCRHRSFPDAAISNSRIPIFERSISTQQLHATLSCLHFKYNLSIVIAYDGYSAVS